MSSSQFCLRWNNHQPNMISVFSNLMQNDELIDVTLLAENNEIHAHKIVLSACSPYFQKLFLRNPCKHPVIILADVKFIFLKNLVEFMYNGEINIHQEHLSDLLRVAELLKVKGLEEISSFDFTSDVDQQQLQQQDIEIKEEIDPSEVHENAMEIAKNLITAEASSRTEGIQTKESMKNQLGARKRIDERCQIDEKPPHHSCKNSNEMSTLDFRELRSTTAMNVTLQNATNHQSPETITSLSHNVEPVTNSEKCNMIISVNPHNFHTNEPKIEQMSLLEPLPNESNDSPMIQAETKPDTVTGKTTGRRKMIRKNENFLRALEAVRFQGMGFCKAARMHGVNNRTLWLEYKKLGYPSKKPRKKQVGKN